MADFNFQAAVQLQGPVGLQKVRDQIERGLKDVNVKIGITGLDKANKDLNTLDTRLRSLGSSFQTLKTAQTSFRGVATQMQAAATNATHFGEQIGLAARRFAAFTVAAESFIALAGAVRKAASEAVAFQHEIVRIAQVANTSIKNVQAINKEVGRLSTTLGVSSKELISVASIFQQAGLSIKDTEKALQALAKSALAPNFDKMSDTAEGAIAVMQQFHIQADKLEEALGSMNAVAGKFATEARDLVEVVKRAGGAFSQTGGQLNELLALFTSVRQTTRESAESIATGLRTIFTRIQRNDTVEALKQLRIDLRYTREEAKALGDAGLENQFVGAYQSIERLSRGLQGLRTTDPRYAAVIEQLGGYRQVSRVIPLLQQFAVAQQALSVAQAGSVSLTKDAEQAQASLLVRTKQLQENFASLFRTIVESKSFNDFASGALSAANATIKLVEALKPLVPLIAVAGSIKLASVFGSVATGFARQIAGPSRRGFATGGSVPGSGAGDTVPSLLTPGEFVIRRDAASKIGLANLQRLNAGGVHRFAAGGPVPGQSFTSTFGELSSQLSSRGLSEASIEQFTKQLVEASTALTQLTKITVNLSQVEGGRAGQYKVGGYVVHGAAGKNARINEGQAQSAAGRPSIEEIQARIASQYGVDPGNLNQGLDTAFVNDVVAGKTQFKSRALDPGMALQIDRAKSRQSREAREAQRLQFVAARLTGRARTALEAELEKIQFSDRESFFPTGAGLLHDSLSEDDDDIGAPIPFGGLINRRRTRDLNPFPITIGDLTAPHVRPNPNIYSFESERRRAARVYLASVQDFQRPSHASTYGVGPAPSVAVPYGLQRPVDNALTPEATQYAQYVTSKARRPTDPLLLRQQLLSRVRSGDSLDAITAIEEAQRNGVGANTIGVAAAAFKQKFGRSVAAFSSIDPRAPLHGGFGTTLANAASANAKNVIGQRGGTSLLSDQTQRDILLKQQNTVFQQTITAEQKLIQALHPNITKIEAQQIAFERVNRALGEELNAIEKDRSETITHATILKDVNGQILGLKSTVQQVNASGKDAASVLKGSFLQRVGGRISSGLFGSADGSSQGLIPRLRARHQASLDRAGPGFHLGLAAFSIGASYAAAGLEEAAGTPEQAAASRGAGSRFRFFRGSAGGLQGAAVGAQIGGLGGPVGAAIGAIVGGGLAIASALKNASKEIEDAKIVKGVTDFSERLNSLAGSPNQTTIANARSTFAGLNAATLAKSTSEATGFFTGFDAKSFGEIQAREERQQHVGNLPAIGQFLTGQAEGLAKSNLGTEAIKLADELRKGNNGFNEAMVQLIARVRNVPVAQVLQEFAKQIKGFQDNEAALRTASAAHQGEERSVNAFSRLVQAIQSTSDSMHQLRGQLQTQSEIFAGSFGASRVHSHSERLGDLDSGRGSSLAALRLVGNVGGPSGRALSRSGFAINRLGSVLPDILSHIAATNPNEGEDFATAARSRLTASASELGLPPNIAGNIINTIIHGINELSHGDPSKILEKIKIDPVKFSEELLAPLAGPIKEAGAKAAKLIEDNANEFVEGLHAAIAQRGAVGDARFRQGQLGLSEFRTNLEFSSRRNYTSGSALLGVPLDQLNAPLIARQRGLLGGRNDLLNNPAGIKAELDKTNEQILAATKAQQKAFAGGDQNAFKAAAKGLADLQEKSQDLSKALKEMTEATSEAAKERLAALEADREGRLGFGEQFITADPGERLKLSRGLQRAQALAANPQGINSLLPHQAAEVFNVLKSFENSVVFGGRTGGDVRKQLIETYQGGIFAQPKQLQAQRNEAEAQVSRDAKNAKDAAKALADGMETASKTFFTSLNSNQKSFYEKLTQILAENEIATAKGRVGEASVEQGRVQGLARQRGILGRAGITTDAQLTNLRGAFPDVQSLNEKQRAQVDALRGRGHFSSDAFIGSFFKQSGGLLQEGLFGKDIGAQLQQKLSEAFGNSPEFAAKVIGNYQTNIGKGRAVGTNEQDFLKNALKQAIVTTFDENIAQREKGITADQKVLTGKGLNSGQIRQVLGEKGVGLEGLKKSLDTFSTAGQTLAGLDQQVAIATERLKGLNETLKILEAARGGAPIQGHATGGMVTGPLGRDNLLSRVSSGEFVVNRASTMANLPLLAAINASGGQHFAIGGEVRRVPQPLENGPLPPAQHVDILEHFGLEHGAGKPKVRRRVPNPDLDRRLRIEAARNPFGNSARLLLGNNHRAIGRHYYAGRLAAFRRASHLANEIDPFAAFGAGRPGFGAQQHIGVQAIVRGQAEQAVFDRENEALRRIRIGRIQRQLLNLPQHFASGGPVDSVPAMLAPGEFVMRKAAVDKIGVGQLRHMNAGGEVTGTSPAHEGISPEVAQAISKFASVAGQFTSSLGGLTHALTTFGGNAAHLSSALAEFPKSVTLQATHTVAVQVTGLDVLQNVNQALEPIATQIAERVVKEAFKKYLPEVNTHA